MLVVVVVAAAAFIDLIQESIHENETARLLVLFVGPGTLLNKWPGERFMSLFASLAVIS